MVLRHRLEGVDMPGRAEGRQEHREDTDVGPPVDDHGVRRQAAAEQGRELPLIQPARSFELPHDPGVRFTPGNGEALTLERSE